MLDGEAAPARDTAGAPGLLGAVAMGCGDTQPGDACGCRAARVPSRRVRARAAAPEAARPRGRAVLAPWAVCALLSLPSLLYLTYLYLCCQQKPLRSQCFTPYLFLSLMFCHRLINY